MRDAEAVRAAFPQVMTRLFDWFEGFKTSVSQPLIGNNVGVLGQLLRFCNRLNSVTIQLLG